MITYGKKLCGILTEASVEAETGSLNYAIVGIGINVRTPEGGLPEEIRVISNGKSEPARALSINEHSHLIIEKNGKTETILAGEISIRLDGQSDLPK